MANAKGKVVVGAEVPEELRDELDTRADAEGRSRADVIGRAIRFYLRFSPVVRADDVPPPLTTGPGEEPERAALGKRK